MGQEMFMHEERGSCFHRNGLVLKAGKEKMEQQVKCMNVLPGGFVSPHPATCPAGVNKMMAYSHYGGFPMWQWIPPTALDTSQDHALRPPVA